MRSAVASIVGQKQPRVAGHLTAWFLGLFLAMALLGSLRGQTAHAQAPDPGIVVDIVAHTETGSVLANQPVTFTVWVSHTGASKAINLAVSSWQEIGATTTPSNDCSRNLDSLAPGGAKSYTCTATAPNSNFQQWVQVNGDTLDEQTIQVSDQVGVNVALPASVSGRVWRDENGNGVQESGEPGLGEVAVRLFSTTRGFIAASLTDSAEDGAYYFDNLLPDTYQVRVVSPVGEQFSPKDQGSDDAKDSDVEPASGLTDPFTLASGQSLVAVDAGLYEPGSISGFVWEDLDKDNTWDPNESGVVSVTVQLLDSSGSTVLDATQTDVDGLYGFPTLAPGAYQIRFQPPAGYLLLSPANGVLGNSQVESGIAVIHANATLYRPVLRILTDTVREEESAGAVSLDVELVDRPNGGGPVTVQVATTEGSAKANQDFTPISTTLTFNPGESRKSIQVTILDDSDAENEDEAFNLSLFEPQGARLGEPATARVVIQDNDPLPGTPPAPPCTADRIRSLDAPDTNGVLDALDIQAAAGRLGQSPLFPEQDLDGDGVVELEDLFTLAQGWRARCDGLELSWAQDSVTRARRIYLHWRWVPGKNDVNTVFQILRRTGDTGSFTVVGEAKAAPDLATFQAQAPSNIRDLVRNVELADQNLADDGALLAFLKNPQNRARVTLLADTYPEIAQAVGLGFVDTNVPATELVTYYVQVKGDPNAPIYGPVAISSLAALAAPTNLREGAVYQGPSDLGISPTTRPITGAERYDWDGAQVYRQAHGTAFLLWDIPSDATQKSNQLQDPFQFSGVGPVMTLPVNPNVAGYKIYRKGPATGDQWQIVNPLKVAGNPSAGYRLIQPGKSVDPVTQGQFFYADRLVDVFETLARTQPSQVFTTWEYKVCPVDLLGNEGPCSQPASIRVRDLLPPAPVADLQISPDEQHTKLTLTWTYTATDQSAPLKFYVLRSPDPASLTEPSVLASLPITAWVDITPNGLTQANTAIMTYQYTPPKQGLYWFRIQVRDAAGNWSAPSAPAKGGLYPRQKPPAPSVADVNQCQVGGLSVNFTGLASQVRQLIVYRSFDPITNPNAPGVQLIQRVKVENGQATFTEAYKPPVDTWVYYKVEALDGYGNVSDPATFKARLCGPNRPDAPEVDKGPAQWDPDTLTYQAPLTYTLPPTGVADRKVTTLRPDQNGLRTDVQTVPPSGKVTVRGEPGETVKVEATERNDQGQSPATVRWVRNVNNFLDTNRHMARLGQPLAVEWDLGASQPTARVLIPAPADNNLPTPYVALFRKTATSNWIQVTPVVDVSSNRTFYPPSGPNPQSALVITDTADLDITDAYDYTVLAFSPSTLEVLGYWGAIRLQPLAAGAVIELNTSLSPGPTLPCSTGYDIRPPSYYGPGGEGWWNAPGDNIVLANGWILHVDNFYDYDGGCNGLDLGPEAPLFGEGNLIDGDGEQFPANFYDIYVDPDTGDLVGGRIVVDINKGVSAGRLVTWVEKMEFQPSVAWGQMRFQFPDNVKVVDPTAVERSKEVRAVVENVSTDYLFQPLVVDTTVDGLYLVDENLPWSLHTNTWELHPTALNLMGTVTVQDRLGYAPPAGGSLPWPDNNLGFLRPGGATNTGYTGANVLVNDQGLQGSFDKPNPFTYVTSLPGGVEVTVQGGAQVTIDASQIVSGALNNASARLDYYSQGTDISFISQKDKLLRVGTRTPLGGLVQLSITPPSGQFTLQDGGLLRESVSVNPTEITWTGAYTVYTNGPGITMELYGAAASFPENGAAINWNRVSPSDPAPAENAWRKLDALYAPSAKLDPGLNIIGLEAWAACDCFDPAMFKDVDLDLYVRRGGVSGNFRINAQSFGEIRNKWGYLVTIKEYDLLFVDNAVVDGQARLDLRLPYPSDVVIPLRFGPDGFDERGCPVEGQVEQVKPYVHKFWNFRQTPRTARFVQIGGKGSGRNDHVVDYQAKYQQNTGKNDGNQALPGAILVLRGTGVVAGLGKTTTQSSQVGVDAVIPMAHDWFPNGDYGDIRLYPQGNNGNQDLPDYFRVSGVPYALTDVKLSRFYSAMMDESSLPDPAGVQPSELMGELPPNLLDSQGKVTGQSLKRCADRNGGKGQGCGFILVDGNGAVVHFGEIGATGSFTMQSKDDTPKGKWPLVTNVQGNRKSQAPASKPNLRWAYPIANKYLDEYLPFKLMVNDYGGALVGIKPDVSLLPGGEVLKTDLGVVVTVNFTDTQGFQMDFGLFAGYAASQAGIRALAMNRPGKNNVGIAPYQKWDDVEKDAKAWMEKFGYGIKPGDQDDPLDLAKSVWSDWKTGSYTQTFQIIEPKIRALKGKEAYGITGIQSGQILKVANATLATGMGQVIFEIAGGDFRLMNIKFGTLVDIKTLPTDRRPLFHADWLTLEITRDGEIIVVGKNVSSSITGDRDIKADIYLIIGTKSGYERLEGGIIIARMEVEGVVLQNTGAVFGAGRVNFQPLAYLGIKGEGTMDGLTLGGALLFGLIDPRSQVLREAGFDTLLKKVGLNKGQSAGPPAGKVFGGVFFYLYGDVPIYNSGCLLKASAGGELQGWYFAPVEGGLPIWGGFLRGNVTGTALCLIHAKGELTLSIENVQPNAKATGGQQCGKTEEECTAFTGQLWVAIGLFACEPETWRGWDKRWWNDEGCWQAGVLAQLAYIDQPPSGQEQWVADFKADAE